jgi:trehalose-6-phosphatase
MLTTTQWPVLLSPYHGILVWMQVIFEQDAPLQAARAALSSLACAIPVISGLKCKVGF